ncbi:MAG: hypothetical protein ACE5JL_19060, partial [Dehalococcoidia bacterium]
VLVRLLGLSSPLPIAKALTGELVLVSTAAVLLWFFEISGGTAVTIEVGLSVLYAALIHR